MKRRYVAIIRWHNMRGAIIGAATGYGSTKKVACQNAGAKFSSYFNASDFGRAITCTWEVYTEHVPKN